MRPAFARVPAARARHPAAARPFPLGLRAPPAARQPPRGDRRPRERTSHRALRQRRDPRLPRGGVQPARATPTISARFGRRLYLVATDLDSGESVSFGRPGPRPRADLEGGAGERGAAGPLPAGGDRRALLRRRGAAQDAARLRGARRRRAAGDLREPDRPLRRTPRRGEGRGPRPAGRGRAAAGALADLPRDHPFAHDGGPQALPRPATRAPTWCSSSPSADDRETFFTNIFSYATRQKVCEHAYQRTRRDLLKRRYELEPMLARHGIRLRVDVLAGRHRGAWPATAAPRATSGRQARACPAPRRTCATPSSTSSAARRDSPSDGRVVPSEPSSCATMRPMAKPVSARLDGNAVRTQRTRARILAGEPAALQRAGRGARHHRDDRRGAQHEPGQPLLPLPQQG